jgi:tripartite-type tricarboxylate transporter receptor subunit TctC
MLGVPQHGAAPAAAGTISGQMQFMFPSLFTAYPHIKAGRLRAYAVAGPSRVPALPDVPTLKESGVDEVDVTQWYALFAPTGTPTRVVQMLNEALNCVLADTTTVERLENHGAEVRTSTPEELRSFVQAELARWRRVVQEGRLAVR